jgi:acyl transferase domain-containing protein
VTGAWITSDQATDPGYWTKHLRSPVRFSDAVALVLKEPARVLLEVGAGRALSGLARHHDVGAPVHRAFSSLPAAHEKRSDVEALLEALGQLWLAGVEIDWFGFSAHEKRCRVALPTYPFERQRYWVDRAGAAPVAERARSVPDGGRTAAEGGGRTTHSRPGLDNAYAAPQSDMERTLTAIWEDVLSIAPIGIHDNFLDLGGDSLIGLQVVARANRASLRVSRISARGAGRRRNKVS